MPLKKYFIIRLSDGTPVYEVNADYVNTVYPSSDFKGGHSWIYSFIGSRSKPQIWLPKPYSKRVFGHEVTEYRLMRYYGLPYLVAHFLSNIAELFYT